MKIIWMQLCLMQNSHLLAILSPMQTIARDFSLSFVITATLIFLTPEEYLIPLFIVFGQGHFILMYLYQFRAGKIGARYIRSYIFFSALLLGFLLFYPNAHMRDIFLLLSAIAFGLHFFFDELFMREITHSQVHTLFGFGFSIQYIAVSYTLVFGLPQVPWSAIAVLTAISWALALPLLCKRIFSHSFILSEIFLYGLLGFFSIALFVQIHISAGQILAFTVLFHYIRWYLFYASRLHSTEANTKLRKYIIDTVLINTLMLVGFIFYFFASIPVLSILFSETYFYLWTILHVIFSLSFFHKIKSP